MSTKIGGPHKCNIHADFPETDDVNEWNKHCSETEGHTIVGSVPCSACGAEIKLEGIPYQPIGKELKLQCPKCFGDNQELNKLVNSQQKQAQVQAPTPQQQKGGAK